MTMIGVPAIRCVGALIHNTDGKLLLVLRANEPGRGLWSVPGGRVEQGEDDQAAVQREVAEETELTVTVLRLCGVVERPAPTGTYVIHDYLCAPVAGAARAGSDAADVRWVSAAEFAELHEAGQLVDLLAETLWDWGVLTRP
ncbi:MAG TPA: NUDIX domain-containing protein [Pseudonocardiaceae bacterium]|nr:NUDIX domain-containing protein [Pseudonocardiaceae bacterium]